MKNIKVPRIVNLISALSILICSACAFTPAVPAPESASGAYVNTGFEYYRWEEGLRLMIWIDEIESSDCATTTNDGSYELSCYAVARDNTRFDWHLITSDGINAEFSIDNQPVDLAERDVFVLESSAVGGHVRQLTRDLSELPAEADSVTEFGLADEDISVFLQISPHIADCVSSSIVQYDISQAIRIDTAREVLVNFFTLLHDGEYGRASTYYGGEYEGMRDHNPGIAPDDYAALFQNACTVNGAQCLKVRRVTFLEQPSPAEFRFVVQFANEDGSLFWRGPCCGDDRPEMQRQDEFIYTVRIECTGRYLVMELPVYLP